MIYTQWGERSHLPVYLIAPFRHPSPFEILLNPQEKPSFIVTFNLVKQLVQRSQCCSKTHIFENEQLSGKERVTTELNFLSIQVKLTVKVKLNQLCTQDSKKNPRNSRSIYRIPRFSLFPPPLSPAPHFYGKFYLLLLLSNFGD